MKVKDRFLSFGTNIRFWEDKWLGNFTLHHKYPSLYNIARGHNASIASVFRTVPLNISFRWGLVDQNLTLWHRLVNSVAHIVLTVETDGFRWNLHQNGSLLVKSMYNALICNGNVRHDKVIWRLKMPLKIKIFFWYLRRGVILTKDNLAKRNWGGSQKCVFCSQDETIQHLFFHCHYARFIWCVLHCTFGISILSSFDHIFNGCLYR